MRREAERLGAVEAQRAEREEPDCGEAAEREFWVGCGNMKKRSPRSGRDIWRDLSARIERLKPTTT